MKIVINRCFGGFSLSQVVIERYLEKQGKECFTYEQTKYRFKDQLDEFTKVKEGAGSGSSLHFTKDLGESFNKFPEDDSIYVGVGREVDRADPLLIEAIEEIGVHISSGSLAELSIVEIPDGTKYIIKEYDGQEHIAEEHRTWY